jgi:hypothetical protein
VSTEQPQFQALLDYLGAESQPVPYREAVKQLGTDISTSTYRKFALAFFRQGVSAEYKDVRGRTRTHAHATVASLYVSGGLHRAAALGPGCTGLFV